MMLHTYRNTWAALIFIATLLLLAIAQPAHAAPELTIGNYQLISSERYGRTEFEYTYKAAVTNTGSDALDVSATLSINAPGVTVLRGTLRFGDVAAGATVTSADTFIIRHDRVHAYDESHFEWTTRSSQPLAPPSDPLVIDLGDDEFTLEINTQMYEGLIDAPLPDGVTPDSLSVEIGIDSHEPVASNGRFNVRMNDHATGLLRVVNTQGDTILLQVFPKAEALVRVNPQITPLSTAVALVMLQPGLLMKDPLLDALVITIIEQLPETTELANAIAAEISQGTFALSKDYSPDIAAGIGQILHRLAALSEVIGQADSIDDLLTKSSWDKLIRHIEHFASRLIKPAHADSMFVKECSDSFYDQFTGHSGERDDVCISANVGAAGTFTTFDITNQRTRWAFMGVTEPNTGELDVFKSIPPRHIDIPGATGLVKGLVKLGLNAVEDIGGLIFNFKDTLKKGSAVEKQILDSLDKLIAGHKTSAQFRFSQNGEYLLSTIGYSKAPLSVHSNQDKYLSGSFGLTIATEVVIPFVSMLLDVLPEVGIENELGFCFSQSGDYLVDQIGETLRLQDKLETGGAAEAFANYIVFNIMLEPKAWTFFGCALGNLGLTYDSFIFQNALKALINELGGPLAFVTKMSSGIDFAANLGLFLGVFFDKDLAAEDFYRVKVGNTVSSGSFQIGNRVEVPLNAGTVIVYYTADGDVKGVQSPGAQGTVTEETTLDGSKWWNVDFDTGLDGWVTGNALKLIDGNAFPTPIPTTTTKLNDTGITVCTNNTTNGLLCPVNGYPGQDAEHGRDALAAAGLLQKVGGGSAGFDFTKLDTNGNPLPANATEWSCVKDNHTGLIWEEKTTSGLRSMQHTYTWYNPDSNTNGGNPGHQNGGSNCSESICNTHGYVQAVNAQGLCGANDWRMPAREELRSIIDYSRTNPAIDTAYFPNTPSGSFWSASPYANNQSSAWCVNFSNGDGDLCNKSGALGSSSRIRLVRDGQ